MSVRDLTARVDRLAPAARAELTRRLERMGPAASRAGESALVAYVVSSDADGPDTQAISNALRRTLPEWMIPATYVPLDRLPRTPNGKVDRHGLPAPEPTPSEAGNGEAPRDDIEAELAAMWAELLGCDPPGVHEDFFALGGHSLLALRLTSTIQQRFGTVLPIATVFQSPTIARLANAIRESGGGRVGKSLVAIRAGGSERPLFCAHCIKGRVHQYFELAEHLGTSQPVYGIQPACTDTADSVPEELSTLAARYLQDVRAIQPAGPYRLCGHSFGGIVAFEMAQQLRDAGQEVELLALLDTVLPRREDVGALARRHRERLAALGIAAKAGYLLKSGIGNVRNALQRLRRAPSGWRQLALVRLQRAAGSPLAIEQRDALLEKAYTRLMMSYSAAPYPGRVVLFRGRAGEWVSAEYPERGWTGVVDELVVEDMPGVHGRMLFSPHVQKLCARIRSHLSLE